MKALSLPSLFPNSKISEYVEHWDELTEKAGISSRDRLLMFLTTVYHETQGFTRFEENLNYSAQGLADTWPNRFAKNPDAKKHNKKAVYIPNERAVMLHRKPELIANTVYSNRMGNRGYASGDGWHFRGRGMGMVTGAELYVELDGEFKLDRTLIEIPETILHPYWSLASACYFWGSRGLEKYADARDIKRARKVWNGGTIGLDKVIKIYKELDLIL